MLQHISEIWFINRHFHIIIYWAHDVKFIQAKCETSVKNYFKTSLMKMLTKRTPPYITIDGPILIIVRTTTLILCKRKTKRKHASTENISQIYSHNENAMTKKRPLSKLSGTLIKNYTIYVL